MKKIPKTKFHNLFFRIHGKYELDAEGKPKLNKFGKKIYKRVKIETAEKKEKRWNNKKEMKAYKKKRKQSK